jgi:branched-chain amino acid transport system permease protein
VPFGDLAAYAALTMGSLQQNQSPGTIRLVALLASVAVVVEIVSLIRRRKTAGIGRACLIWFVIPMLPVGATLLLGERRAPWVLQLALSIALVLPIGPLLYRIVFQPVANAPILVLLMISVALHFVLSGLALLGFGPEGLRTRAFLPGDIDLGRFSVSGSMLVMIAATVALSYVLFLFFHHTITGKALRATAMNRDGARLVGVRATRAGATSFLLAAAIAAVAGVLIGPTTTIYYDTGLMIGLKGFVGATVGGFIGYPAAVLGAVIIGLIESFSSFYASAFKDVIVFASIIPIVLWRWLAAERDNAMEEEVED